MICDVVVLCCWVNIYQHFEGIWFFDALIDTSPVIQCYIQETWMFSYIAVGTSSVSQLQSSQHLSWNTTNFSKWVNWLQSELFLFSCCLSIWRWWFCCTLLISWFISCGNGRWTQTARPFRCWLHLETCWAPVCLHWLSWVMTLFNFHTVVRHKEIPKQMSTFNSCGVLKPVR